MKATHDIYLYIPVQVLTYLKYYNSTIYYLIQLLRALFWIYLYYIKLKKYRRLNDKKYTCI